MNDQATSIYHVHQVLEYEVPVITIYYQASDFLKPAEVAHIYTQPKEGYDQNYAARAWVNDFTSAYIASMLHGIHVGTDNNDTGLILRLGDVSNPSANDDRGHAIATYAMTVPQNPEGEITEPSVYAIAQIFMPSRDVNAALPRELHGYDAARVVACITSITDLSDDHQKPPHEPCAASFKSMLLQAAVEDRFLSLDNAECFNPPYTDALGNWIIKDQQHTAPLLGYDRRDDWVAAKRKSERKRLAQHIL
jgi:hypothetical protein